ncbi:MAG: hypothetical protein BWY02_02139 [bacterium ADurb.Bin157]|nr:MAG: hypothetical protein BWY02_02139 [bacterium ADurb.Bin157]
MRSRKYCAYGNVYLSGGQAYCAGQNQAKNSFDGRVSKIDTPLKAVSVRDFIFREEGVRCFLLAYLGLSDLYEVYSEPELNKGYADLYIKPRLDGSFTISTNHYLIELKHIKQADIKPRTKKKLIDSTIEQAKAQLDQYALDSNVPKDVIKIIAITSSNKLLYLTKS